MRQVNVSIPAHLYAPTQDVVADHLCRTGTKRHNSRCPGLFIHDPAKELPRIPLPRTRVNKGYMSRRRGCGGCLPPSMPLCYPLPERERVEALKSVPQLGTFWADGASGATGYRTKREEVACCETPLVGPFGYVRTSKTAWVLDRAYANF
jgi:hypothetical protein